jgi:hypothetical protein
MPPDTFPPLDARIAIIAEYKRNAAGVALALGGPSPCDGCPHVARCREGLACTAMRVFVSSGRVSAVAPRQPSAEIYRQLYGRKPRPSPLERRRAEEALRVKLRREAR